MLTYVRTLRATLLVRPQKSSRRARFDRAFFCHSRVSGNPAFQTFACFGVSSRLHAVKACDHDALLARLADGIAPDAAIAPFVLRSPAPTLPRLDTLFAAASVEAVLERLDREGAPFAQQTAALIRSRSPTSLKLIFRALREAKAKNLNDCLKMEYRIGVRAVMAHDFREGVRAVLIDKNNKPAWQPPALAGVNDAAIAGYFASLGANELGLES